MSYMQTSRAPNRTLDLRDLSRPTYRRVIETMTSLLAREEKAYLHPSKQWEYPWALERAELHPGDRVLDAGCGASIFPVYLAAQGFRTIATDVNVPPRLGASRNIPIGYLQSELGSLALKAESLDTVFCISVLEHLSPGGQQRALHEFHRVLRPGGRCLITTDFYDDAHAQLRYEGSGESFAVDWNVFDESRLRELLSSLRGLRLEGELDTRVDWDETKERMRRFHGYPYTSIGITLVKCSSAL